jgi:hypothetical protein
MRYDFGLGLGACSSLSGITIMQNTHSRLLHPICSYYFPRVVTLSMQTISIKSQKFEVKKKKAWTEPSSAAYWQYDYENIKILWTLKMRRVKLLFSKDS